MEKERNFSFKSSKFLTFAVIVCLSFVLLTFLPFLVMKDATVASVLTSETHFEFERPALDNALDLQNVEAAIDSGVGDGLSFRVNSTNLMDTLYRNPQNFSGHAENSVSVQTQVVQNGAEQRSYGEDGVNTRNGNSIILMNEKTDEEKREESQRDEREPQKASDKEDEDEYSLDEYDNSTIFLNQSVEENGIEFRVEGNGSQFSDDDKEAVQRSTENDGNATVMDNGFNGNVTSPVGVSVSERLVNSKNSNKECDLSKGWWVFDESYPLYTNYSCSFIDEGFDCKGNGRLNDDYMKWRWQPLDCDLLRFNATRMLERLRGKRLVFVGDSINRNQWESMLCMLMRAIKDPKKVYETHRRRITKEKGYYSFRFVDYQCTVEFYVSHHLVQESKARIGQKRKPTLRIDSIDRGSSRWRGADVLIFNTANWWTHTKTSSGINYYQEGKQVHPRLHVLTAFERALTTWANWVDRHVNPNRTRVFFRSSAPSHFRGGEWNTGGHCREAKMPLNESNIAQLEKDLIVAKVIRDMKTPVTFLNVTGLSAYRIDGHPSVFANKMRRKIEDCSHWCLPGVPDAWNELLYHHLVSERTKTAIHLIQL